MLLLWEGLQPRCFPARRAETASRCSKPIPPFAGVPKSGKPARRAH